MDIQIIETHGPPHGFGRVEHVARDGTIIGRVQRVTTYSPKYWTPEGEDESVRCVFGPEAAAPLKTTVFVRTLDELRAEVERVLDTSRHSLVYDEIHPYRIEHCHAGRVLVRVEGPSANGPYLMVSGLDRSRSLCDQARQSIETWERDAPEDAYAPDEDEIRAYVVRPQPVGSGLDEDWLEPIEERSWPRAAQGAAAR